MTRTIILAAGGTGGHLFPAEALAGEIAAGGGRPLLVTDARSGGYAGAFAGVDIYRIHAGKLSGGGLAKLKALAEILRGILQAQRLIKAQRTIAVVGFGGYPSFPTVIAATLLRVPVILHEQNAVLGRANRVLARFARAVAVAYPQVKHIPSNILARRTGNPVRAGILALHALPYAAPPPQAILQLLVLGGSQGASIFGTLLPAACALLMPEQRARLAITQQARADDLDRTRGAYAEIGMQPQLSVFFTDMPERLATAHLVIARAGASTLAEIAVAGKPSILVPLPSAMDDHQTANARALTDAGAAWLMPEKEFTAEALAAKLSALLQDTAPLTAMAAAARAQAHPAAARELLQLVLETAGESGITHACHPAFIAGSS